MADISDYMTVRQVMDEIGARARSTVTRLLRDESDPAEGGKPLVGIKVEGHGWLIRRASVVRFLRDEAARPRGVGFPRGETRAEEPEPPKKAKKAKKAC